VNAGWRGFCKDETEAHWSSFNLVYRRVADSQSKDEATKKLTVQPDGGAMRRPAVFLDRDGVINRYVYNAEFGTVDSPANAGQFELLPGVGEAIALLNRIPISVIAVSNQPGVAHGKFSPALLDTITEKMRAQLAEAGARLDGVLYCRHHPEGLLDPYRVDCECRLPRTGLLKRAATERNLNLEASYLVGDGVDGIFAGGAAGLTTFLVSPRGTTAGEEFSTRGARPNRVVSNLMEAVTSIRQLLRSSAEVKGEDVLSDAWELSAVRPKEQWTIHHFDRQ
jgi:D-glycero-D-manno-heptose 1,7-bisphosphate phosphatase